MLTSSIISVLLPFFFSHRTNPTLQQVHQASSAVHGVSVKADLIKTILCVRQVLLPSLLKIYRKLKKKNQAFLSPHVCAEYICLVTVVQSKEGGKSKWTPPRVGEVRPLCQGFLDIWAGLSSSQPSSMCQEASGISSQPTSLMAQTTDPQPFI